jgi:putative N6-adenine-specific DNA methylase
MTTYRYFATCARGLEPVLAGELRQLGAADVEAGRGGVAFAGDRTLVYRANLWLRTAIRVLQPILEAPVHSPDELYAAVQTLDWVQYLTLEHTFAVDCNVRDSALTHSQYAAQRTKDAICDQFVARTGRRPRVDRTAPMVGLNLHIARNHMVLSLDSSGASLHKRGYRPIQTKAPLNEALAAGLVLLTGWDGTTPFADPLCGSGTLPIEASWIALRRPPGLTRKRFGFQGWLDFDIEHWTAIRDEARQAVRKALLAPVVGSDVRRDAIAFADCNARAAGVGHLLRFTVCDLRDFRPPGPPPGVILCNPPYGQRIGAAKELRGLYKLLGDVLRERCAGWTAFVFSGNPALDEAIGLTPTSGIPLYNGRIPCRLLRYDLAGGRSEPAV